MFSAENGGAEILFLEISYIWRCGRLRCRFGPVDQEYRAPVRGRSSHYCEQPHKSVHRRMKIGLDDITQTDTAATSGCVRSDGHDSCLCVCVVCCRALRYLGRYADSARDRTSWRTSRPPLPPHIFSRTTENSLAWQFSSTSISLHHTRDLTGPEFGHRTNGKEIATCDCLTRQAKKSPTQSWFGAERQRASVKRAHTVLFRAAPQEKIHQMATLFSEGER